MKRPADRMAVMMLLQEWPLLKPLRQGNYLLLFVASVISYVGANLTLVAFPWLMLNVTDDALAMGTVMAVAGIPRAAFMLFGGAVTDRLSPRTVMLVSTVLRFILMAVMATLTLMELITFWQILILALLFGTLDAFFWPASSAIIPTLLDDEQLPAGNALLQGAGQLSLMLGPLLAGTVIAMFAERQLFGIAMVFYLDTAGFLLSAIALFFIRPRPAEPGLHEQTVWESLRVGLSAMWNDLPVRTLTLVLLLFTFFFRGPHMVGLPVLADARFDEGALAYGMIMSGFGLGALAGIVLSGSIKAMPERWLGLLFLVDLCVLGLSFFVYAWATDVRLAMAAAAVSGALDGYFIVVLISWLQRRIDQALLGRVMSVIMFATNGLVPISAATAGWLLTKSIEGTFLGAGAAMVFICITGLLIPAIRRIGIP